MQVWFFVELWMHAMCLLHRQRETECNTPKNEHEKSLKIPNILRSHILLIKYIYNYLVISIKLTFT